MSRSGWIEESRQDVRARTVFTIISVISKRRDHRISPISTIDRCQKLKKYQGENKRSGWTAPVFAALELIEGVHQSPRFPLSATPTPRRRDISQLTLWYMCVCVCMCMRVRARTRAAVYIYIYIFRRGPLLLVSMAIDTCPTLRSQVATRRTRAFARSRHRVNNQAAWNKPCTRESAPAMALSSVRFSRYGRYKRRNIDTRGKKALLTMRAVRPIALN